VRKLIGEAGTAAENRRSARRPPHWWLPGPSISATTGPIGTESYWFQRGTEPPPAPQRRSAAVGSRRVNARAESDRSTARPLRAADLAGWPSGAAPRSCTRRSKRVPRRGPKEMPRRAGSGGRRGRGPAARARTPWRGGHPPLRPRRARQNAPSASSNRRIERGRGGAPKRLEEADRPRSRLTAPAARGPHPHRHRVDARTSLLTEMRAIAETPRPSASNRFPRHPPVSSAGVPLAARSEVGVPGVSWRARAGCDRHETPRGR